MLLFEPPMSRWLLALPLAVVIAAPAPAWALKPATHRQLAEAACAHEGMPVEFCRRMGKQAYETDYHEWEDLSAHAQREEGQDRCDAADAAIERVDRLARTVVTNVNANRFEEAAIALGAALHTIQDECAHHGMTNQEHAYYSLTQQCTGDEVSPDVQPAALACARTRTAAVMALTARALTDARWAGASGICTDYRGEGTSDACANAVLPSPFMACDFLAEYKAWDGGDSTWDPTAVGDALVSAFGAGLAGELANHSACAGDPSAIDPPRPHAIVTDRTGLGCFSTSLGCLGKVDEGGETDELGDASGGCSTGAPANLLVLALGLVPLRRRRRRVVSVPA